MPESTPSALLRPVVLVRGVPNHATQVDVPWRLLFNLATAVLVTWRNLLRAVLRPRLAEWLVVDLDGPLPARVGGRRSPWAWPRGAPRSLSDLAELCRRAAAHAGVKGVVFRLRGGGLGGARVDELRAAFAALRAAGKEVVVHAEALGNGDYRLAAAASRVLLVPGGRLGLTGVAARSTTVGRGLRQLGIQPEVVRAGSYKSAGELFANDAPSPEARQVTGELADGFYALLEQAVAEGRNLSREAVAAAIDEGPYTARGAVAAKLADGVAYWDEIPALLGGRLAPLGALAFADREAFRPRRSRRRGPPRIAVVSLDGTIVSGRSRRAPFVGGTCGDRTLGEALAHARRDESISAVVLHVRSRGGSALASDQMWREVQRCAAKKPVVAFLEEVAASGGYYAACAAHEIVAEPTCLTGSIGVITAHFDASGLFARLGVRRELTVRGKNAALGDPAGPLPEHARAALVREISETYEAFLARVAEGRKLPLEEVRSVAEGRVYLAPRALQLRLVDSLGLFDAAVARARALAKLGDGEVELVAIEGRRVGVLAQLRRLRAFTAGEVAAPALGGPLAYCDAELPW